MIIIDHKLKKHLTIRRNSISLTKIPIIWRDQRSFYISKYLEKMFRCLDNYRFRAVVLGKNILKILNFYDVFEYPAEALAKHPAEFRWDGGYIFFKLHEFSHFIFS